MALSLSRRARAPRAPRANRHARDFEHRPDPSLDPSLDAFYRRIEADYGFQSPAAVGESPGPIAYQRLTRMIFPGFQFEKHGNRFGSVRQVIHDIVDAARNRSVSQLVLLRWLCERNDFFYGGKPVDLIDGEPDHLLMKFRLSFRGR